MTQFVDQTGRPLRTGIARAKAVVFTSADGESWDPVPGYNVPDWVRDHEVMADMLEGFIVSLQDSGPFYKAERLN